ncbi:MAG: hypothetical protein ACHQ51_09970 [Elusimicrobiota bacterium]
MKTPMLAALLFAVSVVPALAAPDASFDSGVDVAALAGQAKEAAQKDKTVVASTALNAMRYDMDCASFNFGPNDKPVSDRVWLRSQEWVTECQPVGDPRHGGGQNCWERPGMSWSQGVQLTLQNRPALLPWEHDSFRVCLQGPWVYTDTIEAAYDYKTASTGRDGGDIVLVAGRKTPESPDPVGVLADLGAQLKLNFTDKWASYYPGEQIVLKVELKKVVKFWPDATLLDKEITLPVAATYGVDLNQFAGSFSSKPEAGKQYYVKYSIKRVGSVSNDRYTKTLETAKISYAPAAIAFAR